MRVRVQPHVNLIGNSQYLTNSPLFAPGIECTRCRTFAQCEAGDNCLSVVSCSDETEHERCLTTKPCKLKAHANRQVSLHANCENNDGGYINGNSTFTDSVLNMLLTNCDLPACNYEGHPEELGGVRNLADGGSEFLVRARSRAAARALRRCLHRQVIAGCEVQRMPRRVKSIVGTGVYAP
eukprot:TRINITY_DN10936_c1_g4_i3.p2 TRINITY_DN10936_c1_g4~~TRINITY_DN10936_c1_g4_i3.p2  ORF type:complete len:181 (+),score=35.36 TRINITY_DN10936_c1_g4_i3:3073-3615(+)